MLKSDAPQMRALRLAARTTRSRAWNTEESCRVQQNILAIDHVEQGREFVSKKRHIQGFWLVVLYPTKRLHSGHKNNENETKLCSMTSIGVNMKPATTSAAVAATRWQTIGIFCASCAFCLAKEYVRRKDAVPGAPNRRVTGRPTILSLSNGIE